MVTENSTPPAFDALLESAGFAQAISTQPVAVYAQPPAPAALPLPATPSRGGSYTLNDIDGIYTKIEPT